MAKGNTVELSPSKADEDEAEVGSEDEHAVEILNASVSSIKSAQKPNQSTSYLSRFLPFIGKPTKKEVEQLFYPSHNTTDDGEQNALEEEEVEDESVPRGKTVIEDSQEAPSRMITGAEDGDVEMEQEPVASAPITPQSTKKRVSRDIYNVDGTEPEDREEGGEINGHTPKKMKRVQRGQKAKAPITSGRTIQSGNTPRETRAQAREGTKTSGSELTARKASQPVAENEREHTEVQKRRPGRPRKATKIAPKVISEPQVESSQQMGSDDVESENEAEDQDTVDLYLDPSPVKPSFVSPRKPPSNGLPKQVASSSAEGEPVAQSQNHPSAVEEQDSEECDEIDDVDVELGAVSSVPTAPEAPEHGNDNGAQSIHEELSTTLQRLIPIGNLDEILEDVERVGQKHNKKADTWRVVETATHPFSVPGKRMDKRLKLLIKNYTEMPALQAAGGSNADDQELKAVDLIKSLLEQAEPVFSERLPIRARDAPKPDDLGPIHSILRDIYFIVIPKLVTILKLAVEAYQDTEPSEMALKQIVDILGLLRRLGDRALQQPDRVQLKSDFYRTSAPTSSVIQRIRLLSTKLQSELSSRQRASWAAGASERERKQEAIREAREQQERIAKHAELQRIYREQQAVLDAKMKEDSIDGVLLRKSMAQLARSSQLSQHQASQRLRSSAQDSNDDNVYMSIQDDPFADQDGPSSIRPLSMYTSSKEPFGKKNSNKRNGTESLSEREKLILLKTLRVEKKSERYELAAKRLGREMEEIVKFAQLLQEIMDDAHSKGKWNTEEDRWTYVIWVKPVERTG